MQEIDINLRPSKQFVTLFVIILLGGFSIVFSLPIPGWFKSIIFISGVIYSSYVIWRYGLLKSSHSITKLTYHSNNWLIQTRLGTFPGELSGDSTVTGWVCILRYTVPGKKLKQTCLICQDSVNSDQFRRLIVALRM